MNFRSMQIQLNPTKAKAICFLALCVFINCSKSSAAAEPANSDYQIGGGSGAVPEKFAKWHACLKKALQKNDKMAIAKMVADPLVVYSGGDYDDYLEKEIPQKSRTYNQNGFLKNYDCIFTRAVRDRLLDAWKSEFWDRDQGVCLATGAVWIDVLNDGAAYKIKVLNYGVIGEDIDEILEKIKSAETAKIDSGKIADLYNLLGLTYDHSIRGMDSERGKTEGPDLKKKAEAAYKKAISLRTGAASKSEAQARSYRLLADNLISQGEKTQGGEDAYLKALAIQQAILPPQSKATAATLSHLKSIYADAPLKLKSVLKTDLPGREASIKELEKALSTKASNQKLTDLSQGFIDLGDLYEALDRQSDAQKSYDKAYEIWKKMPSKNEVLSCNLLKVIAERGNLSEAKKVCSTIKDFGNLDMAKKSMIFGFAKSGNYAEAEKLMQPRLAELESSGYGSLMKDYVDVYIIEKKLDKALALAELAIAKDKSGYKSVEMKAKVEALLGQNKEAEKCYQDALDMHDKSYPNDPPALEIESKLAEIYFKNANYGKALELCNKILAAHGQGDNLSVKYADALGLKAQVLAQESNSSAAKVFRQALEIKTKLQGPGDKSVLELKTAYDKFLSKGN